VTTERTAVPGCWVRPLGVMRYVPVASKSYMKRYLPDGFTAHAVAEAPSLAWNRDDALQDDLVRKAFRRSVTRPVHFVPTAEGFGAAVRAGLGCIRTAWPHHICVRAPLFGSPMCTLTYRCSGSAGNWTVR
jgi:LysR family transcriptional regulator (chromosome initiation inhibitor)